MLFSSISFLYVFLPAVLLVYALAPKRFKNLVLLLFSLVFYAIGEPVYVTLLLVSAGMDYVHARLVERYRGTPRAKLALLSSIVLNLAILGFFKYADFLIGAVNGLLGTNIPLLNLPLPIGVSFFTFQTMSYVIDVYRGEVPAEKNLLTMSTYVCLFPQLVAGPIVRYQTVAEELHHRTHDWTGLSAGIERFIIGLAKKVLLANLLGEVCAAYRASASPSVLYAWLYAVSFMLQIYFDFSGYSDMAIGLGRMFGFHFPENFNYPYIARTITEFWRRWHITLSSWFRDYVYIPLGGNRVSRWKWVRNILVVWMLTGLWHGAAWNFLLWGAFFGVLLLMEKLLLGKRAERMPAAVGHVYVLFLVLISFVIFNADGLGGAAADLKALFGGGGLPFVTAETLYQLRSRAVLLVMAAFGATPLPKRIVAHLQNRFGRVRCVAQPLCLLLLLLLATAYLVDGSFNPFLYFRF